jgi:hypothetical protein
VVIVIDRCECVEIRRGLLTRQWVVIVYVCLLIIVSVMRRVIETMRREGKLCELGFKTGINLRINGRLHHGKTAAEQRVEDNLHTKAGRVCTYTHKNNKFGGTLRVVLRLPVESPLRSPGHEGRSEGCLPLWEKGRRDDPRNSAAEKRTGQVNRPLKKTMKIPSFALLFTSTTLRINKEYIIQNG